MKKPRQIVALGGGMFSMEADNGLLDKYILNLALKEKPKICFFGTASNDGAEYREMFYKFFNEQNCEPSHLSFLDPPDNIEEFIMEKDIIHVGGGNTTMIMETWKKFGVDKMMKKAWESGIILTGMSAGAICWFDDGITNPSPGVLTRLPCLGILKGSFCPHYDDRAELKSAYEKLILEGTIKEGFGVEDGAAVHFVGNDPVKVIASRTGVTAYKVRKVRNKISETPLQAVYLGKESDKNAVSKVSGNTDVLKTAITFFERINEHDVEGLCELMTEDHKFVDSMGTIVFGKDEMKKAWQGFFDWFPDYHVTSLNTLLTDDTVGFFGTAKGTFNSDDFTEENKFEVPASWRAKVKDNLIAEWQAIADNESVRKILDEHGRKAMIKANVHFENNDGM